MIRENWGLWWWDFDKEDPLQEDLVVYEKFMQLRRERERMNQEKARQKEEAATRKSGGKSISSSSYSIPDPI